MSGASIWIVDDEKSLRWVLEKALQQAGFATRAFSSGEAMLAALKIEKPQVLLTDIRMPGMDGLTLLSEVQSRLPLLPVIVMTAHADLDSAVKSYQGGAFEYLPKPFDLDEAVGLVRRALMRTQEAPKLTQAELDDSFITGEAPAMQEVFRIIGRLSQSNMTVLIHGESGTGKERVAAALHRHSPRANKPFIALNMAAIPKDLIESELFGHEKGAFTGAAGSRTGRFEQADGGTLFLDEIGDMPLEAQTRLLRVLADGVFYRVGGHTPVQVNVRILAATHRDLEVQVQKGVFREDLFHRLNVIRLHLPRLSERREDIPKLAAHFLQQAAREMNVEARVLSPEAEAFLSKLDWPGNVRQLENTCRWLTVMAASREVLLSDLPAELLHSKSSPSSADSDWQSALRQWARAALRQGARGLLDEASPTFERILLEAALEQAGGRKRDAAELLGWGRNTLTRKLKELGMEEQMEED
ncbi:MAG: nitrogen regulation protein [Pseudomonadota bacterium]|jgi:two-component system nitrogen regulation response regulator GlnG